MILLFTNLLIYLTWLLTNLRIFLTCILIYQTRWMTLQVYLIRQHRFYLILLFFRLRSIRIRQHYLLVIRTQILF